MSCKSLETLSRQTDALYAQFTSKTHQSAPSSVSSARMRDTEEPEGRQCIFLEGELLIFSEMTRSEVVTALQNMGLVGSAVTITTEGDPLYFVDESNSDTYRPFDYFLQQSDLPYGFAGPEGKFQFSSPELVTLQKSSTPVFVDDAYIYGGNNGAIISYETLNNPNYITSFAFCSPGLAWTKSTDKQTAMQEIARGEFPHITLRDNYGRLERRDIVTKDEMYYELSGQSSTLKPMAGFLGSLGNTNYLPSSYIGWRMVPSSNNTNNFSTTTSLLVMPEGQLTEFEVNPSNQQPYRGAEGVYPVILVELNEDVNIEF